jgi:hypothetical protein
VADLVMVTASSGSVWAQPEFTIGHARDRRPDWARTSRGLSGLIMAVTVLDRERVAARAWKICGWRERLWITAVPAGAEWEM